MDGLNRIIAGVGRHCARHRAQRWLWLSLLALLVGAGGLLLLDALFALPAALRAVLGPLLLLMLLAGLGLVGWLLFAWRPPADESLRLAEGALGDGRRRLTASWQLARDGGALAQRAVARWTTDLRIEGLAAALPRLAWRPFAIALLAVLLLAGAVHLVLPDFYARVVPRFVQPFGDHPPYSLSALHFDAAPERVLVGDDARFVLAVDGRPVSEARLAVGPRPGTAQRHLPMYQIGGGRWQVDLERVDQAWYCWAEAAGTRTTYHHLGLDPLPVLDAVDVQVVAPAYAGLEDDHRRWQGDERLALHLLPASELILRPQANRPLTAVEVFNENASHRLTVSDGMARWSDPAPGAWSLRVIAIDGVASEASDWLNVTRRRDDAPSVRIERPGRDAVATPAVTVPLVLAADDDLGLDVVWRWSGVDGPLGPELSADAGGARQWRHEQQLDIGALGLRPGQVLIIEVMARDGKPGGGQVSSTERRLIRVISEEEYNRLLRRRLPVDVLERKYQPLIDDLAELERRAGELRRAQADGKEVDAELRDLERELSELQKRVGDLHRDDPLLAVEPDLQRALREAAERLAERLRNPGEEPLPSAAEMLRADLALMTEMARAMGLLARLKQIIDAEQGTTALIEPLTGHRRLTEAERIRLREAGDYEEALARSIERWHELAAEQAERLEERGALKASTDLRSLDRALLGTEATSLKQAAAAAARRGDAREAFRHAAEARDRLLALLSETQRCMSSMPGGLGLSLSWCSGTSAGACLSQMAGLSMMGYGSGGAGRGGFGLALGYGGTDPGSSEPSMAMELFGAEDLGGSQAREGGIGDAVSQLASGSGPGSGEGGAVNVQHRTGSRSDDRIFLSPDEEALLERYFRALDDLDGVIDTEEEP